MRKRLLGGALVALMASIILLAMPAKAAAECIPLGTGWENLPAELIVWMFWFNYGDVMQWCAYQLGTYDPWPLIQCVVGYTCAWG